MELSSLEARELGSHPHMPGGINRVPGRELNFQSLMAFGASDEGASTTYRYPLKKFAGVNY